MWRRLLCLPVLAADPAAATVLTLADDGRVLIADAPRRPAATKGRHMAPNPWPPQLTAPLADAAQRARLADQLIGAVAWVESRYSTSVVSPAGAIGLMQLMPATARDLGVDARDPVANLAGGASYLRRLLDRFDGDLVLALAAYNAGPGAVERHRGVPPYPETRAYVARVLARLAAVALHPEVTP